jgi:hypothetical protein
MAIKSDLPASALKTKLGGIIVEQAAGRFESSKWKFSPKISVDVQNAIQELAVQGWQNRSFNLDASAF